MGGDEQGEWKEKNGLGEGRRERRGEAGLGASGGEGRGRGSARCGEEDCGRWVWWNRIGLF